ncbi:AAA family ATPase [Jatrophihabitans telluris]|uniref:AAA family ATPase n=1 Tax=Jatrophihabitans telluris TaxID=2038343 RepID=A0ABY4QU65_9ACTN|nr:AAA family ATPase [Jatrophihabitans telluris]UQX86631.1 AAA family ATPase [Jatrophihabitans telluris]
MQPSDDRVFAAFCASGLWPGLGITLAGALAEAGIRTPGDVTTSALASLPKVGQLRAGRLLSAFIAAQPAYDIVALLLQAGLAPRLAGRCVEIFGPGALRLLKDDPWRLLQLSGVSVADADALARAALPGILPSDDRRSRALVGWVLTQVARDGDTLATLERVTDDLLSYRVADPQAAIAAACEAGAVEAVSTVLDSTLALTRYAEAEREIASSVHRLTDAAKQIGQVRPARRRKAGEDIDPDGLDSVQRSAVDNALTHGLSVLTGGPGTGKSRTVATLVREAERAGKSVALAAPTGRAAKRLAELCDAEAMTIHRMLGVQPRSDTDDDGNARVDFSAGFARGADWPLDQDIVVVDEASMLDVELAAALLRACADGTHVLVVGDSAQLPSIGPGQVLADLIGSNTVPVVELTTLYRQEAGGAIARLATAVRSGSLPAVDSPEREVVIVPARGSAECAHRVVQLMTDSIPRALEIPAEQIQVVTPVHRGPAGTLALNAALKAVLNPPKAPSGKGFSRFDEGDRVVATANHLEVSPTGFANGEVGVVTKVADKVVTVDFGSGPAEISGKALADITHGWAITVHRAQGSEFRAVIVVLPPEAGRMLSRPLVYTGLTRAQRHLSIVHGTGPALAHAVHDIRNKPRRTALRDFLG